MTNVSTISIYIYISVMNFEIILWFSLNVWLKATENVHFRAEFRVRECKCCWNELFVSLASLSNMLIHGYQVYIRWRELRCLRPQSWRLSMGQMYGSNVHLNLPSRSLKKLSLYPGLSGHLESR